MFYAIHITWRVRGFAGDNTMLPVVQLLSGIGLILMVSLRDPLRDTLMFQDFAQGIDRWAALALLAFSLFDYEREFEGLELCLARYERAAGRLRWQSSAPVRATAMRRSTCFSSSPWK